MNLFSEEKIIITLITMIVIFNNFLNKLGWKIIQKTCNHKNKKNEWIDYQEQYYKDYCPECKLTIYTPFSE
jgi:hypothetical protein